MTSSKCHFFINRGSGAYKLGQYNRQPFRRHKTSMYEAITDYYKVLDNYSLDSVKDYWEEYQKTWEECNKADASCRNAREVTAHSLKDFVVR